MRPTTINAYAAKYDRSVDNNFAAACYDQNSIPELIQALTTEPDPTDCKTWSLTPEEWIDAVYAALYEKAGGGFSIAVVWHWYGKADTYDWYKDDTGAGIESEYEDRTIYTLETAREFRRVLSMGRYELSHNEYSRPSVYIVTARDMERVRDTRVSWGNDRAWDGCSCSQGVDFTPCADTECTLCSGYMTATEIAYIREHAIR